MDLGLKGKVALITGAGSQIGMGKAIALTLAREGCDIVAADIDLEGVKKQRLRLRIWDGGPSPLKQMYRIVVRSTKW